MKRRHIGEARYSASDTDFDEIVGESAAMRTVLVQVKKMAMSDATVLIVGGAGTGKELMARAIHRLSTRWNNSFVKVNCAAIPTSRIERELFGCEHDALSRSPRQKSGRVELANHGILFLGEIANVPLALQAKLLRLLERGEFEHPRGVVVEVNVRLIVASGHDLGRKVSEGQFRGDLYAKLSECAIRIPSLHERREDIPSLARYFVQKASRRMNKRAKSISTETMEALQKRDWPGNVRDLESFVERSIILTEGSAPRSAPPSKRHPSRATSGQRARK